MNELQLASPPFPYWGEIASALTALFWACSLVIYSRYGKNIPADTLNLYKNTLAFTFLALTALILCPPITWTWFDLIVLGLSGIIGLSLGDTAFFAALSRLGAQITASSQSIVPPLTALIAFIFLGETLSLREWVGLMITLIGITLVLKFSRQAEECTLPDDQVRIRHGWIMALVAALCQATAIIVIRYTMQNIDVVIGTLTRLFPAIVVLLITAYIKRGKISVKGIFNNKKQAAMISIASFMGAYLCLMLMTTGAKYAKAGISTAIMATYPIWVIPISYFYLHEKITAKAFISTLFAIVGVFVMVL